MNRQILAVVIGLTVLNVRGIAEEIELFRASQAGEKAWVWDSAQAKQVDGKFLIRLHNGTNDSGNAFIADRFPYFPNAKVEIAVIEVPHGNYTFQVLGFSNNQYIATADLIDKSNAVGRRQLDLKAAGFDQGVDEVAFKIWIGGAKDAAVRLDDLIYSVSLDASTAAMDETFKSAAGWKNESLVVSNTPAGVLFTVKPGTSFGSILSTKQIAKRDGMSLLWNIAQADGGDASLQLVAFDQAGKYLKSVDIMKNVRTGWHGAALDLSGVPKETSTFEIKIWVGGQPSAVVRFGRLLVLQPSR